jgi:hypothetical protein
MRRTFEPGARMSQAEHVTELVDEERRERTQSGPLLLGPGIMHGVDLDVCLGHDGPSYAETRGIRGIGMSDGRTLASVTISVPRSPGRGIRRDPLGRARS